MFETLDIIISLAVVFLILSMIHKYLISMIKRLLKVKASVIAEEMKTFIGEKTTPYLIMYIQEKAKHLNILEGTRSKTGLKKGEFGFRQMNKEQLKAVIEDLREFLDSNTRNTINDELRLGLTQDDVDKAKAHIESLLKVKAVVSAGKIKTLFGKNTSLYLNKYIQNKANNQSILKKQKIQKDLEKEETDFRKMNAEQLKAVIEDLREFLDSNTLQTINKKLNLGITKEDFVEVKAHLGKLRDRIEKMYDNTLEKISEMYESRLRTFTIVCGLILAIGINADFFNIYSTLSTNAVSREKLITNAETIRIKVEKLDTKLGGNQETKDISQDIKVAKNDITTLAKEFKEAGLLLGWTEQRLSDAFSSTGSVINKVLGLLLSGLLISFGAPFWNDFLSSLMGVRKLLYGKERERSNSAPKGLKVP